MDLAHPLGVTLRKVVVYRYDMHALARESVEVRGQRGHEGLAFTRFHFGNSALVQTDTADNLNVEVLHFKHAPARLSERRERVEKNFVERFARRKSVL